MLRMLEIDLIYFIHNFAQRLVNVGDNDFLNSLVDCICKLRMLFDILHAPMPLGNVSIRNNVGDMERPLLKLELAAGLRPA